VNEAPLVYVGQSPRELTAEPHHIIDRQAMHLLRRQVLAQRSAGQVLEHQVLERTSGPAVVQGHDVVVAAHLNERRGLPLGPQDVEKRRLWFDQRQGNVTIKDRIQGKVGSLAVSFPQQADDLVPAREGKARLYHASVASIRGAGHRCRWRSQRGVRLIPARDFTGLLEPEGS
jgi:hypothetical protein